MGYRVDNIPAYTKNITARLKVIARGMKTEAEFDALLAAQDEAAWDAMNRATQKYGMAIGMEEYRKAHA